MRFLSILCAALLTTVVLQSTEYRQESITGNIPSYLQACVRAANDPLYFQNFRRMPEYAPILECGYTRESAAYLLQHGSKQILDKLSAFNRLEAYGNPVRNQIPGIGEFSGTTLRYIVVADQLTKFFNLPQSAKIAEIGAGFGGQCYIISQILPFSKYYMYDLPEVELLINKMMTTLSVNGYSLLAPKKNLPERSLDLLISNYAFSEMDRKTQLDYFERVLKKAKRGYILFNQLHYFDSLSPDEFVALLQQNGMNPEMHEEPVFTYTGNCLIIWDKTKGS